MTFVSLADACRRLNIDVKTGRRWLADAQLPLQSHPRDGRKKGMSSEHLDLLARLHQRSLAPLTEVQPVPVPGDLSGLSAALLALPEMVGTLQTQIAALQQHLAELTQRLQSPFHPPASPPKRTKRPSTPSPPCARSVPKASRKSAHVIPRVEYAPEGRYVVICPKRGLLSFEPDTPEWFAWVGKQSSFRFVGKQGHFTAHHEWRVPRGAWRAHRHIRNHSYNLRLAPNQHLTITVLEQAAHSLHAHLA